MTRHLLGTTFAAITIILLTGAPLGAQNGETRPPSAAPPGFAGIPFSFAPPGARALGMGGAFIGIADDATAAEANPAGLVILTQPEISLHGRSAEIEIQTVDVEALPLFNFFEQQRDPTTFTVRHGSPVPTLRDTVSAPAFASYVHPFRNWVVSLYYQQAARFAGSSSFGIDDDLFIDFFTTRTAVDVELAHFGVSSAFRVGDLLALGFSARHTRLDFHALRELRADYFHDLEFQTGNLDHIDFLRFSDTLDGNDTDLTFNAGILINPAGRLSLGATYKQGGTFGIPLTSVTELCVDAPVFGFTCNPTTFEGTTAFREVETATQRISIPDFLGAGLVWRVSDQFLVAVDAHHITYSNLGDLVQLEEDPEGITTPLRDRTEIHVGLEYTILAQGGLLPISLRAGFFTDPDHDGIARHVVDSSDTHYTAGLGFVFQQNLQLDLAGRFSDSVTEGMVSLVYRF
jgi:long-chain fatty acid transport protein